MKKVKVNQTLYGIMYPQWGSPVVIPETIRPAIAAAMDAVLWMSEHSLYHGGSMVAETKGKWSGLQAQGYRVVAIQINEVMTDTIEDTIK